MHKYIFNYFINSKGLVNSPDLDKQQKFLTAICVGSFSRS